VGFCTFAFAVTLMLGILWGARMRWDIEQFLLSEEYLTYQSWPVRDSKVEGLLAGPSFRLESQSKRVDNRTRGTDR
jgi:hypothetical protein